MRRTICWALAAMLALTAAVYWQGLGGPLVFDDATNLSPIAAWLAGKTSLHTLVFGNHSGMFGRPLSMASFALNAAITGPGVWGLKFGNLLLHLTNGILVYALFAALLRCGGYTRGELSPPARRWLPLVAAALWLLHPLLASTVLYTVQRMAMLSTSFMLLGMLIYMRERRALADNAHPRAALIRLLLGVLACTVLASLSKENGALTPSLCAVVELCVFQPAIGRRRTWLSRLFIVAALILPALGAIAITADGAGIVTAGYHNQAFTLLERLLTESRVLWSYVGQIVWPRGASMGLFHDDYVLSRDLLHPLSTLFAIVGWLVVVAVAWCARRSIPGLALGVGIFLVGQALESTIFPLMIYFEHRNYLPAIGVIWALLSVLTHTLQQARARWPAFRLNPNLIHATAAATVLVLAFITAGRAHAWSSDQRMLQEALTAHPDSAWARIGLSEQALLRNPPDYQAAHDYITPMLGADNATTRRLGATERSLIDCRSARVADPAVTGMMFVGRPEPLEENQLRAYEMLADQVMSQPCHGLTALQMADGLGGMMARTRLSAGQIRLWHLHLKTAYLYMHADRPDQALAQARMAYAGGTSDAQTALFITDMLLRQHDIAGAAQMLQVAVTKAAADDLELQNAIAYYEKMVRSQAPRE